MFSDYNITDSKDTGAAAAIKKRNIIFFCNTPKGSLPQMRGWGLDHSIIDEDYITFRTKATVDIIRGFRDYLGIEVKEINITANDEGETILKITV